MGKPNRRAAPSNPSPILEPPAPRPRWREFEHFDGAAVEWIKAGNIALTPGIVEKIGGGVSLYVHARDAKAFAEAARMIGADARSVPVGRTGANVQGEFLIMAILRCRDDAGGLEPFAIPACPNCRSVAVRVTSHRFGITGELTTVECFGHGHRWRL